MTARTVKLAVCVGLFAAAALFKLLFPAAYAVVGEKINAAVNYKAALTVLGEGFSGEKKFTAALSEAFTYAFTGTDPNDEVTETAVIPEPTAPAAVSPEPRKDGKETDGKAAGGAETESKETGEGGPAGESVAAFAQAEPPEEAMTFSEAVIAAFKESQEEYSDYAVPAGVTYDMPGIMFAHTAPLVGTVSSPFGFRVHPEKKTVLFHYGIDVAAPAGSEIVAFADGKVIAAGESATLGKYVLLSHGNVETQYAHCSAVSVTNGQTVKMGERIASVGDTGNATSPCLHFELKINGQYVNPAYYIDEWL
jgi:murein DD-endopeptidase MepM/ murein hydrolase activator NlpD